MSPFRFYKKIILSTILLTMHKVMVYLSTEAQILNKYDKIFLADGFDIEMHINIS